MRLDLDFLRKLLLKIDGFETFEPITNNNLIDDDTPINKINAYLDLLIEEELISARCISYIDGSKNYTIKYITFKGQKFIDSIKNSNFWQKCKDKITYVGISSLSEIIMLVIRSTI